MKFSDIREELKKALQKKLSSIKNEPDGVALIEGFVKMNVESELTSDLRVGGPFIPLVSVIGNSTGRVYTYALKALLPDFEERWVEE